MKKVLYVLLQQFAEHELPYLTQPLRSDSFAMKENPKYESTDNAKMVAFYSDIFGFKTEWNGMDPNVEMTLGASRIVVY